ncbi:callose synthase 10-like [Malus domestica]|uniref:callose synthase 10-like n=1 Tax=Malus domestica TaxID=3750 RepID=UPI003975D5E5
MIFQRQEQRWRESGTFGAYFGDYLEMKETIATLRPLVELMEVLSKDADPNGVGRLISGEVCQPLISKGRWVRLVERKSR